jgi:iron complex transport system substrate-binding protein
MIKMNLEEDFMKKRLWKKIVMFLICVAVLSLTACTAEGQSGKKDISKTKVDLEEQEDKSAKSASDPFTITNEVDGKEYEMEYAQAPDRAVSLSGFTTEMMLALGLEEKMAGTAYLDNEILPEYKEAYDSIPVLSEKNPSQEILLNTNPDFITGWASAFSEENFTPDFMDKNGVKFYVPRSEYPGAGINQVYEDFENLGKIFQVEDKAEEVIKGMKEKIEVVESKVKESEPVSVFLYDSGEDAPFTAGASLVSDLIRLAGGKNVFEDEGEYWLTVQWESVVEKNPEWIVVMQYNVSDDVQAKINTLKNNEALKNVDAIKNNRILIMGLSDVMAGVRNVSAVENMAVSFHPDEFK